MPQEEELKSAILMVFANKQDQAGAMTASQVSEALSLQTLKKRTWYAWCRAAAHSPHISGPFSKHPR